MPDCRKSSPTSARRFDLARKKSAGDLESRAIDLNVIEQMKVLKRSALFKKRVADGSVKIVGARYNLQSGKVEILDAGN